MRAVVFEGKAFQVVVRDVPKARIIHQTDAVIRITTAAICGSDLHIYHGVLGGSDVPYSLGHEAIGIIEEVGSEVTRFKIGDRVLIPGSPNPDELSVEPELSPNFTAYGIGDTSGDLGGCQGRQSILNPTPLIETGTVGELMFEYFTTAEYVRVPNADASLVEIDNPELDDKEYLFMSDILATAWAGLDFAGFQAGDTVVVFGAGPVGLMTVYSAFLRGAAKVYAVDHVKRRLDTAASMGAIPIDFTKGEPSSQILEKEPGGVKRCVDCVGEECLNEKLRPQQNYVITQALKCVCYRGGIGVLGVYYAVPSGPGVPRGDTISPEIPFPMTLLWSKGVTIRAGAVPVLDYQEILFQLIKAGRARPGFIVTGVYNIEDAPKAYERFDKKLETKVLFQFPPKGHESGGGEANTSEEATDLHG